MEVIFLVSFIFSFLIFLVGVIKNSWVLSFSGSLLLVLFSSVTIVMSSMGVEASTITVNVTDSDGSDVSTVDVESVGNDPYTFVFALIMGVFSCFFMLFSLFYLRTPKSSRS
jgi:hypothetical protein